MRRLVLFFGFISLTISLYAQKPLSIQLKDHPVICYARHDNCKSHVPPPKEFLAGRVAGIKTSTIEVTFVGNFPNEAKVAFQYAVDIWEALLTSSVPIKVQANWSALNTGVLGSAIYWSAYANFDDAQKQNVFYPVALAEKIAGEELNGPGDFEIFANFSSNINWYFGTAGQPAANQYDFVTVVLHEIGHGLGFSGSFEVDGTQGTVGAFDNEIPIIYDAFIENGSGIKLLQGFNAPSPELRLQLISSNLRSSISKTPATTAQLYAPSTFDPGSSISHLDEGSYPPGSGHSLMTPQIGFQESNHEPGALALGILSEMGWEIVRMQHQPLVNTENETGPYNVTVKIIDDVAVQHSGSPVLHYTSNGTSFTDVTMTPTGNVNEFNVPLPVPSNFPATYGYYISVADNVGRTVTRPGKIVDVGNPETQGLIIFEIGPDTKNPTVLHVPEPYLQDSQTQLEIKATIRDNIGIGSASVTYSINNGSSQTVSLLLTAPEEDSVYTASLNLGTLQDGDVINYTITAVDNSNSQLSTTSPETGTYSVGVFGFATPVDTYTNNFNTPSSDFFGSGFSVSTPSGFNDAAVHSDHPYSEGDPFPDNELNLVYVLKIPIRISEDLPWMSFDEIVLVEPGEDGSAFGEDEFYDYVVVEGSLDLGETWKPLQDGYDSRTRSEWLAKWNSSITGNNSTAIGNSTLYRHHGINLDEAFDPGDEIVIRFRLFSDQLAKGWGWSLDNISIQDPVTQAEKELEAAVSVYPNPAYENVILEAEGLSSVNFEIELMNIQGQLVYGSKQQSVLGKLTHTISTAQLPSGLYIMKISNGGKTISRKVVKTQ